LKFGRLKKIIGNSINKEAVIIYVNHEILASIFRSATPINDSVDKVPSRRFHKTEISIYGSI